MATDTLVLDFNIDTSAAELNLQRLEKKYDEVRKKLDDIRASQERLNEAIRRQRGNIVNASQSYREILQQLKDIEKEAQKTSDPALYRAQHQTEIDALNQRKAAAKSALQAEQDALEKLEKDQQKVTEEYNKQNDALTKIVIAHKKEEESQQRRLATEERLKGTQEQRAQQLANQTQRVALKEKELAEAQASRQQRAQIADNKRLLDQQRLALKEQELGQKQQMIDMRKEASQERVKRKLDEQIRKEKQLAKERNLGNKFIDKTSKSITGLTKRIRGLIKRVLIFSIILRALRKLKDAIADTIGKDSELSKYVGLIKGNISVMGRTIFEALRPAILWVLQKLYIITRLIAEVLAKALGKDAKQMAKMAEASKKTAKNAERTTFAFDTLQKVESKKDKDSDSGTEPDFTGWDGAKYTDEQLAKIMAVAGAALLAVGLILVFTGVAFALGLAAMAAGVALLVKAAKMSETMSEDVRKFLGKVMAIAGAALLALGVIMCFVPGQLPLAIAAIVAGVALIVAAAALNWDTLKEKLGKVWGKIKEIALKGLIVLGIILCLTGVGIPLGIPLIKKGAEGLAKENPEKYDDMPNKMQVVIDKIKVIASKALLVLGVILCFTGIGIPLGLALIYAGAQALKKSSPEDYEALKKKVIEVIGKIQEAVTKAWNKIHEKTQELKNKIHDRFVELKLSIQQIIANILNFFIRGLNWAIEKANKLIQGINSIDIFGYSPNMNYIPYIPYAQVPALAKGAVIPGGSPFLAMLGDQRKGQTNIETPLETMIEAFRQAQGEQQINITFEGSLSQLARILNPQIKKEQKRASIW